MNAKIQSPALETAEDVTEAFDEWQRNPSAEMIVRKTGIGTQVTLFVAGRQVAKGHARGLVNAIAHAFEEMAADEASR